MVDPKLYGVPVVDESHMSVKSLDSIFKLDAFIELNKRLDERMEAWKITGIRAASVLWRRQASAKLSCSELVIRTKVVVNQKTKFTSFEFDYEITDIQEWPTDELMTNLLLLSQGNHGT